MLTAIRNRLNKQGRWQLLATTTGAFMKQTASAKVAIVNKESRNWPNFAFIKTNPTMPKVSARNVTTKKTAIKTNHEIKSLPSTANTLLNDMKAMAFVNLAMRSNANKNF